MQWMRLPLRQSCFELLRTKTVMFNNEPRWNETFAYSDMTLDKIQGNSIEVVLWDCIASKSTMFFGEVLLDLKETNFSDDAIWYSLADHDENIGPLPTPSIATSTLDLLRPSTPVQAAVVAGVSPFASPICTSRMNASFTAAQAAPPVGSIEATPDKGIDPLKDATEASSMPHFNNIQQSVFLSVLVNPQMNRIRRRSSTNEQSGQRNYPESTFKNMKEETNLGPGQIVSKYSRELEGNIKLAFVVSKGKLEVDIISAGGLPLRSDGLEPDTYVKICLLANDKRLKKKKTQVVRSDCNPAYREKLVYSACIVDGYCMQVTVKERLRPFRNNPVLGQVVIALDTFLQCPRQYTTSWYKLFSGRSIQLDSVDQTTPTGDSSDRADVDSARMESKPDATPN
ncbi:hypothetical protein LSAT2_031767 [Lamellibrachia satsuma]|nr:hypothetical protein LSAT2_031767 [Lamellibrachia satsuma]